MPAPNAAQFIKRLKVSSSAAHRIQLARYFKAGKGEYAEGDNFIGVRMGDVFALAAEFIEMPLDQIEKLLESTVHEARAGALSIMAQQCRRKKTPEDRRKDFFDLYLRRHDRINNWDLVDLGAPYVVGTYLTDKPRKILYKLARSKNLWERRTAIVATGNLIRRGEVDDTFKIATLLLKDKEDLIHKGTGWMLRAAGDKDRQKLLGFLDQHAAIMPRTLLRYALEHLPPKQRAYYMNRKQASKR